LAADINKISAPSKKYFPKLENNPQILGWRKIFQKLIWRIF